MKFNLSNTTIPFMSARIGGFIFSTILIILSFGSFFYSGLNFGIDFKGGTLIEIETVDEINIADIRSNLNSLSLGDVQVQEFGSIKNILIRIGQKCLRIYNLYYVLARLKISFLILIAFLTP